MRCVLPVLVGLLMAWPVSADEPTLEVRLVPERLGVEDVAQLKITISNGKVEGEAPRPARLDNFEIVGGPSVGRRFSLINGRMSSSVTYTYALRPRSVGPAGIGPVQVEVDGTTLSSSAIVTEIQEGSVQAPRPIHRWPFDPFERMMGPSHPARTPRVALRLLAAKGSAVVGEVVPVKVVLDTTAAVEGFEWVDTPSFPGWWSERLETEERVEGTTVEVDGVRYRRYPVMRWVLIPLEAGRHELPSCSARIGLRSASLFARPQILERSTKAAVVHVASRPEPPEGFCGATGDLEYDVRLEPQRVAYGESATLTVTLSGVGNLPLADAPLPWPAPEGVEIYEPEESLEVEMTDRGPRGRCIWTSVVLPRRAGSFDLGSRPVAVFDPAAGQYRADRLGPVRLTVDPPPSTPSPTPRPIGEGSAPTPGSPPAGVDAGTSAPSGPGAAIWVIVLVAVVAGAAVGAAVVLLATRSRAGMPPARGGTSPSERARELQRALEDWWRSLPEVRREDDELRRAVDALRRDLESVRFAPGRADHTETVADLEARLSKMMR